LSLTLGGSNVKSAKVLRAFASMQDIPARVWVSGFDMENAKARCFYDTTLPLYPIAEENLSDLQEVVQMYLDVAEESSRALTRSVKEATYVYPTERESDPTVEQSFWQRSEEDFYNFLKELASKDLKAAAVKADLYQRWLHVITKVTLQLFDQRVFAMQVEGLNMKRVIEAKSGLVASFNKGSAREMQKRIRAVGMET